MSSYEENVTPMEPLNNKTYTFYFEINKNNYKNICIPLPFIKSFNGYKLDNLWNNNKECYDCNINENEFNYPITNSKQKITLSDQGGLPLPLNTFIILDELKGSDIVTFQCASSTNIQGCMPYSSSRVCIGDSEEIEITPMSPKTDYLDTSSYCKDPDQNIYVGATSKLISTTPNSSKEKCEVICSNDKNCEMYLMDSTDCKIYKDVSNVKMYCDYGPKHAFYGNVKTQNFLNKKNVVKMDEITIPKIECAANYGSTTPCCGQEGGTVKSKYICPSSKPICKDYKYGKNWGSCTDGDSISSITNKNKLSIPISCSGKSCLSFFPPHSVSLQKKGTNLNIFKNLKSCSDSSFSLSEGFPACTDNNGNPVQLCVSGNPKSNYTVYIPNSYRKSPTFNSNRVYEKPVFFKSGFYNHSDFSATLSLLQSSIQKGNNLPEGTYAVYEVTYTLVMNSNLEFQLMDFLYLQNKLSGTFTDWFKKTKVYSDSIRNIQKLILDFCTVSKNSLLCKQKISLPNLENQIENFELPKPNKNITNYIILFICVLLIFFIYYRKLYI